MTEDLDAVAHLAPGAPVPGARTRRVLGNTGWLVVSTVVGAACSLLLLPLSRSTLGDQQFGLWSVIAGLVVLFGALDLGLGAATSRSVAFFAASRAWDQVRQVNTVAMGVYTAVSALLGLVLLFTQDLIVDPARLHYAAAFEHDAHVVLWFVYATFALTLFTSIPRSLLLGLEQIRLVVWVDLLAQLVNVVILVVMLERGDGIYALAVSTVARPVVQALALFPLAHRAAAGSFSRATDRETRRSLLSFSGWLQLNNICALVTLQTDRVVIGYGIGTTDVTTYELANKISSIIRLVPLQLLNALLPGTTALVATGDREGLRRTYVDGSRLMGLCTFAISGFVMAAAGPLLATIFGRSEPKAALLLVLLVASYAINALTGLGTTVLRAQGRPRYETYFALAQTVLNIVLTIVLVGPYGVVGVVLGTVVSLMVVSVAFVVWFHLSEEFALWETLGDWLTRLTVGVTVASLPTLAAWWLVPGHVFTHRLEGLALETGLFALYVAILLPALRLTGFLSKADVSRARAVLRRS